MYSLRTQRLSVADGSDQAKQLDAEIQKYGTLIVKSREQVNSLSKERFASKPSGYRFFNLSMLACKLYSPMGFPTLQPLQPDTMLYLPILFLHVPYLNHDLAPSIFYSISSLAGLSA